MPIPFKTIGIIGKSSDLRIGATLTLLYGYLKAAQHTVIIEQDSAGFIEDTKVNACPIDTIGEHCDLVIAVGGDGTFLSAVRAVVAYDIPIIGINLGRLGFLVDISPDQLPEKLHRILQGHYTEEKRYLLRTKIIRDGQVIHEETAVNEVVVHRWITPSMIEIITKIDGVFLNSQRSDGLIISTPTGSTAYSLSAGGPILSPSLNALVLVPLNPHTLSNRPIVIADSAEIEISFCQTKQINALVTCDHIEIPKVLISDKILIKQEPKPIRILHPEGYDYFYILRNKLNWSSGYHTSPTC
ncbi:MAG: NAD(+) kinase [Methylovulum sp.]|uniref:NAD(+) kinase n=1 Tax=Methylovulum sp. TaxID=1916980 RepID=UPI0026293DD8|nr:NAD(+) kinase [Methylovulum sp.]MDD2723088.1 NAD(+) kinase [Methylovulum sp.]MDD5123554.1 NAD(+) kinase [Methylovulum sp.]